MPYSKKDLSALLSKVQGMNGKSNGQNGNWRGKRSNAPNGNTSGNLAAEVNGLRKTIDLLYNKTMMLESLVILSCLAEPSPLRLINSDNKKKEVLRERLGDKNKRHKILAALNRKEKSKLIIKT